jgi:transposase
LKWKYSNFKVEVMVDLPDGRSWSAEQLELMRKVAVRAVFELGKTRREMAEMLGVDENTVGEWCAEYEESGDDAFKVNAHGRPLGSGRLLTPDEEQQIRELIVNSIPEDHNIPSSRWTRPTVGDLIRAKLGIELSEQTVGNYLQRWGLTPQKPARHAREADPDEIAGFEENTLPEAMKRADDENAEMHFCDEAGFQIGDQIGTTYAPLGETPVLTFPKIRIAQNMIASVTPSGELTYELYSGTMNASRFIDWLERLISESRRKIFLFIDSLSSHTATAVSDWLEEHRDQLEVVWLPRYSPAHNPSEFLNNDVKQNLKTAPLPTDTADFRTTLEGILDNISTLPDRIKGFFRQSQIAQQFK